MIETVQIAVDAEDPNRIAEFWAEALDYELHGSGSADNIYRGISDPTGKRPSILFQRVPEGKTVKNRLHIDLPHNADKTVSFDERREQLAPIVERLTGLGARRTGEGSAGNEFWIIMADPEDNEFCVG